MPGDAPFVDVFKHVDCCPGDSLERVSRGSCGEHDANLANNEGTREQGRLSAGGNPTDAAALIMGGTRFARRQGRRRRSTGLLHSELVAPQSGCMASEAAAEQHDVRLLCEALHLGGVGGWLGVAGGFQRHPSGGFGSQGGRGGERDGETPQMGIMSGNNRWTDESWNDVGGSGAFASGVATTVHEDDAEEEEERHTRRIRRTPSPAVPGNSESGVLQTMVNDLGLDDDLIDFEDRSVSGAATRKVRIQSVGGGASTISRASVLDSEPLSTLFRPVVVQAVLTSAALRLTPRACVEAAQDGKNAYSPTEAVCSSPLLLLYHWSCGVAAQQSTRWWQSFHPSVPRGPRVQQEEGGGCWGPEASSSGRVKSGAAAGAAAAVRFAQVPQAAAAPKDGDDEEEGGPEEERGPYGNETSSGGAKLRSISSASSNSASPAAGNAHSDTLGLSIAHASISPGAVQLLCEAASARAYRLLRAARIVARHQCGRASDSEGPS